MSKASVKKVVYQLKHNPKAPFITLIASLMILGLIGGFYIWIIDGVNPTNFTAIEANTMSRLPTPDLFFVRSLIFVATALVIMVGVRSYGAPHLASLGAGVVFSFVCQLGMYRSPSEAQLIRFEHYARHCSNLVNEMVKQKLTVEDYSFLRIKNLNAYGEYHCPDLPKGKVEVDLVRLGKN